MNSKPANSQENLTAYAISTGDTIVNVVSSYFLLSNPELSIPFLASWNYFKTAHSITLKHRAGRVIEFLEMVESNKDEIATKVTSTEVFQDTFSYILDAHANERHNGKRELLRNLFLNIYHLPLEKATTINYEDFVAVLERIDLDSDTKILKTYTNDGPKKWLKDNTPPDYDIPDKDTLELNLHQMSRMLVEVGGYQEFSDINFTEEKLQRLSNLGLLYTKTISGGGIGGGGSYTHYRMSSYGNAFIQYMTHQDSQ